MGYKINHNPADIISRIRALGYECSNIRTDSWVAWGMKQDLYRIKWIVDELLSNAPDFSLEPDWLKEQEQEKIVRYLKDDI